MITSREIRLKSRACRMPSARKISSRHVSGAAARRRAKFKVQNLWMTVDPICGPPGDRAFIRRRPRLQGGARGAIGEIAASNSTMYVLAPDTSNVGETLQGGRDRPKLRLPSPISLGIRLP